TRTYAYDASDRLTAVTRPEGHTMSVGYDGNGRITSQTVNGNSLSITSISVAINKPANTAQPSASSARPKATRRRTF
ncbi:MAG: RHS repeat domain-containing protein, partial [Phycisphaeraceae bacterium]